MLGGGPAAAGRACGSADGTLRAAAARRAGSAPPTPADAAVLGARRGARARPRLRPGPPPRRAARGRQARRSASTSPPSRCGSPAGRGAGRDPRLACSATCPAPGTGGPRCCWTATSASAAPPAPLLRRDARAAGAGRQALVELDPPGAPTQRTRVRLEAPGVVSEWFRVGARRRRRASRRWRRGAGLARGRATAAPAAAGSPGCAGHETRPHRRPAVPAGVLALAAARPVADRRARLAAAGAGGDRRRHRVPLAHRLRAGPARQRDRRRAAPTCRSCSPGRRSPRGCTRSTQGLHVNVGLAAMPFLLAKLWSVIPRLFVWPPVRRPRRRSSGSRSRCSSRARCSSSSPGSLNIAVLVRVPLQLRRRALLRRDRLRRLARAARGVKSPVIVRAYRERGWLRPLRDDLAAHAPGAGRRRRLVAADPDAADDQPPRPVRVRRRGSLSAAGGANVGETIGGPLRAAGAPRPARRDRAGERLPGQQDRRAARGVTEAMVGRGVPARAARRRAGERR